MKYLRLTLVTLVSVWLEVSFFGGWRLLGVIPDLFVVVIFVAASSKTRISEVMMMATGGGFLLDMVSGTDFGLKTAFFCFIALLAIILRRKGADFERYSMKLAAVISATILYDAVILTPLVWLKSSIDWSIVVQRFGFQLVLNVVLFFVLYWPLRWVFDQGASNQPVINKERT